VGGELNEILLILNTREALSSLMGSTQVIYISTQVTGHIVSTQRKQVGRIWLSLRDTDPTYALSPNCTPPPRSSSASTSQWPWVRWAGRSKEPEWRAARAAPPATPMRSQGVHSPGWLSMARCAAPREPGMPVPYADRMLTLLTLHLLPLAPFALLSSLGALHAGPAQSQLLRPPRLRHATALGQDTAAPRC
jgi:hypothetical protein